MSNHFSAAMLKFPEGDARMDFALEADAEDAAAILADRSHSRGKGATMT